MSDYVCIKSRDEVIDGYLKKKSNGNASNFNETGAKTRECVSAGQKPAEPNSTILSMVTCPRKVREPPAVLTSSATSYICIKKLLCGSKGKLNFAYIFLPTKKKTAFSLIHNKSDRLLYISRCLRIKHALYSR